MNLGRKFSIAIQAVAAAVMLSALVAACGGGSSSARVYTASAGVGEVLQLTVDPANMSYSYLIQYTSYSASGVSAGQGSGGSLLSQNPDGTYNLGVSSDGFILAGKVLPRKNGLLAGEVELKPFGSGVRIPLFGVTSPIGSLTAISGVYDDQGFSCSVSGVANVLGNPACASHIGTIAINSAGAFTWCKGGDINTSPGANPCVATVTGSINAQSATPAVFDLRNASNAHIGWFFAVNAPNGRILAVVDHDDAGTPEFGHTLLSTYASAVAGAADGSYLVENDEGAEQMVTIAGSGLTTTAMAGAAGTLTFNSPWPGLSTYQLAVSGVVASSGVAMTGASGAYSYISRVDVPQFGVGAAYGP